MVRCSRNGSSDFRLVGVESKSRPAAAGDHRFFVTPIRSCPQRRAPSRRRRAVFSFSAPPESRPVPEYCFEERKCDGRPQAARARCGATAYSSWLAFLQPFRRPRQMRMARKVEMPFECAVLEDFPRRSSRVVGSFAWSTVPDNVNASSTSSPVNSHLDAFTEVLRRQGDRSRQRFAILFQDERRWDDMPRVEGHVPGAGQDQAERRLQAVPQR